MKVGTKSLLWGSHQFLWHPFVVWLAWIKINKSLPTWKELVCIIIHDWGYWGKPDLDGEQGTRHPEWAAEFVHKYLDQGNCLVKISPCKGYVENGHCRDEFCPHSRYYTLCLYHSRHYSKLAGAEPSKLCWADKLCIAYDPWWFYLLRVTLSGEIKELRESNKEFVPLTASHREWFKYVRGIMIKIATEKRGDAAPYLDSVKGEL